MRLPHAEFHNSGLTGNLSSVCVLGIMLWSLPVGAADQTVPWECTGFAGEARNRCIQTFAELQQEKIEKLEKYLEFQQQTVSPITATRCATSIGHG